MHRRMQVLLAVLVAAFLPRTPATAVNNAHGGVVTAVPAAWTPEVLDGEVLALAQIGGEIVAGGSFHQVRNAGQGAVFDRAGLFAFDARTGVVDPNFAPVFDKEVETLAPDPGGRAVFVGGRFRHVNGAAVAGLAKIDLATGQASPGFSVSVSGSPSPWVFSIVLRGKWLYVGGTFDAVDGTARSLLAAVDPATGALDPGLDVPFTGPRKGAPRVDKIDVTPDGSKLVAIGNFTMVSGQDRVQLAVLDVGSRPVRLANWETDRFKDPCAAGFDTCMRAVDIAPDGSWFVVVTTGAYRKGSLWDAASRFELTQSGTALQPTWADLDGGDSFTGVAVTGATVYVAGHNRWMNNPRPNGTNVDALPGPGAVPREGIAALDPANGLPYSWNPGKTRGKGARALLATADGLWVGSDTESFGGQYHARLALCPLAGGAAIPPAVSGTLPGDLALLGLDGRLVRRSFDGKSAGSPAEVATNTDWSRARGGFMLSGRVYAGWDDGTLYSWTFDGHNLGSPTPLDLHGLPATEFPVTRLSGTFVDRGRLYYTLAGDPLLYYRYFTAESGVVGAETFVTGRNNGLDWRNTAGLTLAGDHVYWARTDGSLYRVDFNHGHPVAGSLTVVARPDSSGRWASRGMFLIAP